MYLFCLKNWRCSSNKISESCYIWKHSWRVAVPDTTRGFPLFFFLWDFGIHYEFCEKTVEGINSLLTQMREHIKLILLPLCHTRAPWCYSHHHFGGLTPANSQTPTELLVQSPLELDLFPDIMLWDICRHFCSEWPSFHVPAYSSSKAASVNGLSDPRSARSPVYPLPRIGIQPEPAHPPLPEQRENRRKPIRLVREDPLFHWRCWTCCPRGDEEGRPLPLKRCQFKMAETETQLPTPVIITVGRTNKAEVNRSILAIIITRQRENLWLHFSFPFLWVFKCPFLGKYSPPKSWEIAPVLVAYVECGCRA